MTTEKLPLIDRNHHQYSFRVVYKGTARICSKVSSYQRDNGNCPSMTGATNGTSVCCVMLVIAELDFSPGTNITH